MGIKNFAAEKWDKWDALRFELAGNFYISSVLYDLDNLKIVLKDWDCGKVIEILFSDVYLYRITNEGLCVELEQFLKKKYGLEFYQRWSLFIVENSSLLSGLDTSAQEANGLTHFVVMGSETIADVLSKYTPEVKILNE